MDSNGFAEQLQALALVALLLGAVASGIGIATGTTAVQSLDGATDASATLAETPPEPDRFEPNDDFANATTLRPGNYTGLTLSDGESDTFKIPIDRGDNITIETNGGSALFYVPHGQPDTTELVRTGESVSITAGNTDWKTSNLTDGYAYVSIGGEAESYWLNISVDEPPEPDPYEPNDVFTNATVLQPGNHTELTRHSPEDGDWFKIPVDTGDNITIRGGSPTDPPSMVGSFPQDDGTKSFLATGGETASATITGTNYENEKYDDGYVYVTPATDVGEYWLNVTIDEPPEPDPYEPNDKLTNATVLQPGNHTELTRHSPEDDDWYKFPVDTGDNVTIQTGSSDGLATMVGLFPQADESNLFFTTKESKIVSATITGTNHENETYDDGYVYIGPTPDIGEYWLNVTVDEPPEPDRFEPNDDFANATRLQPGNYTGLTQSKRDSDWYKIPVDVGDTVTIQAGGNTGASVLAYYPQSNSVATRVSTVGGPVSATVTGTNYKNETWDDGYVYVVAGSDSDTEYWLNITATNSGPEPDRFEPNDAVDAATDLSPGRHPSLMLTESDGSDWYRIPVERGQEVTATVMSDGGTPQTFLYYQNASGVQVETGSVGTNLTGTVTRTEWGDQRFDDGFAYVQVVGEGRYELNVSVRSGTNRAPTAVDARVSAESGTTVGQYAFTRPGEPVRFTLEARDLDGNLDGAIWAKNESTRRPVPLTGIRDTATWSWTFNQSGTYRVIAQAVDTDDAASEPETWTVIVGSSSYGKLSAEVVQINGREAGQHGYRLTRPIDNVTMRITRADGEPVPTESLGVAVEGSSHLFELEHVRGDLYRSELRVEGVQGISIADLIVDSQRLGFTLATVRESELRVDPVRVNLTTATALVTTDQDPLNAPVPGWVYDMDPATPGYTVYVDGQRYLAVEMVRDKSDPYVEGIPGNVREDAWLVFDGDGQLVENPEVRRKAALAAEVTGLEGEIDAEDIRTFREEIPSLVDRFIRKGDQLELLATARDSLAELSGSITVAAATGGSSILAKQSAKSASKALAKRFARKLFTDYISSEVAPDNPIAATEQGLELMSEAGLRRSAREAREVGRILDRRQGADWNYTDAVRYWESYPNATTDLLFYMRVRAGTVPSGAPAAQFESMVESYATGATGVPVGQIQALLSGGGFGYLSEAHKNRTRSRTLRQIRARSFRSNSAAVQQAALNRYDDRVLFDPRPSDGTDERLQDQEPSGGDGDETRREQEPGNDVGTATVTPSGPSEETDTATRDATPNDSKQSTGSPNHVGGSSPGFGAIVAVLALLTATVLALRRDE